MTRYYLSVHLNHVENLKIMASWALLELLIPEKSMETGTLQILPQIHQ